jgi:hypothetical protein
MHPETLQTAIQARKILTDEKNWTIGTFARDSKGEKVSAYDKTAVCWCLEGAIHKAIEHRTFDCEIWDALKQHLATNYGYSSLAGFNDWSYRSHDDVLKFLDSFIEKASADLGKL